MIAVVAASSWNHHQLAFHLDSSYLIVASFRSAASAVAVVAFGVTLCNLHFVAVVLLVFQEFVTAVVVAAASFDCAISQYLKPSGGYCRCYFLLQPGVQVCCTEAQ